MLNSKRGQLTLFVIVALVIVVGSFGGIYLNSSLKERASKSYFESSVVGEEVNVIKEGIEECINDLSVNSLYVIGDQGGNYERPLKYLELNNQESVNYGSFLSYFYYNGKILLPSLDDIQGNLAKYVDDSFLECLDAKINGSLDISAEPETIVNISPSIVGFSFEGEVVLTSSEGYSSVIPLSDYTSIYNVSLFEIYEVAKYLTESHKEDSTIYCASCVVSMLDERNLYLDYLSLDNDTMVIGISDRTVDFGENYFFTYANKYTGQEESNLLANQEFAVMPMPDPKA